MFCLSVVIEAVIFIKKLWLSLPLLLHCRYSIWFAPLGHRIAQAILQLKTQSLDLVLRKRNSYDEWSLDCFSRTTCYGAPPWGCTKMLLFGDVEFFYCLQSPIVALNIREKMTRRIIWLLFHCWKRQEGGSGNIIWGMRWQATTMRNIFLTAKCISCDLWSQHFYTRSLPSPISGRANYFQVIKHRFWYKSSFLFNLQLPFKTYSSMIPGNVIAASHL